MDSSAAWRRAGLAVMRDGERHARALLGEWRIDVAVGAEVEDAAATCRVSIDAACVSVWPQGSSSNFGSR